MDASTAALASESAQIVTATVSGLVHPTIWNQLLVWPILNLLMFFYKIFESIALPGAFGFAMIAVSAVIRILIAPFSSSQMKTSRKLSKLKPELDEVAKKFKDDKVALQKAQWDVYKKHGVNPLGGCLPSLLQMPITLAMYYGVFSPFFSGKLTETIRNLNTVVYSDWLKVTSIDLNFFGVSLAAKPSEWQKIGVVLLAVPLITAFLQWLQMKVMMASTPTAAITEKKDNDAENMPDPQKLMAIWMPLLFATIAYQFPIGLSLYWNVFGIFSIIQQQYINKRHG